MLRRIEGLGAMGLRRMDWDAAAALGRRALGWATLAGMVFLLCRARAGRMAPFAMAFLAAALLAGRNAAALLAGCLAGGVNGPIQTYDLSLPIGAAIALGGSIAWDLGRPALRRALAGEGRVGSLLDAARRRLAEDRTGAARSPAPNRLARSPNDADAVVSAALAGVAVLAPGLALMGEGLSVPAAAEVTAASVAAVAAAPFFRSALAGGWMPRRMTQESRVGRCLLLGGLCAGVARLSLPVGVCIGGALTLLMYPSGALAGVGFGAALLAASGDARLPALLALGGATARLCAGYRRPMRALGFCGAMLAAGLALNLPPVMLAGGMASALVALPMPEDWSRAFERLARPALAEDDPRRLAAQARRQSSAKLRALGAAFGELAEGYLKPVNLPDEQALTRRLRGRLCACCGDYEGCWAGQSNRGARLLCDLIARAAAQPEDAPLFEGEVTPELLRRCRRGRLIPERAQDILEDFARTRRAELRRAAQNQLVSAQFLQARQLLECLAAQQARPPRPPSRHRLRVSRGAACVSREAGAMSGDSHIIGMLDETRLLALISDGMGSGADAAAESRLAARLLGRFLRAGAPVGLAVETVNALLLNRGGEDMFATADILILDLESGEAEFVKLAACPTWIARRGEALRVEGGRLPLGILERVEPQRSRGLLEPGDVVLMVSDGVLDAAGAGTLEALALENPEEDPSRLAERALDAARAACDEGRRDDMTALCLRVERQLD